MSTPTSSVIRNVAEDQTVGRDGIGKGEPRNFELLKTGL